MNAALACPLTVRIARSPAEAREAWREVTARGNPGYHGQTFEWYDAYHRSLGAGRTSWVIAIVLRAASPVGVLPLCAQETRVYKMPVRALALPAKPDVQFLCDVAASEPLPVAGLDQGLGSALARAGIGWDVILFQKVREDSKAAALLAGEHVVIPEGNSSWFSCREGYEAIAANYSSRLKKSLKQARKRLRAEDGVEIRTAAGDGIGAAFAEFLQVEASGWKAEQGSAIAQVPERRAFYELLIQGGNGVWRPEINLLRLNGRTVAAQLCVRAGRTLSVLKIGYDESHRELTPGNVLLDHLLKTSCESGDTDTVSLVTDMGWMADWGTRKTAVLTLMRFNHTAAGLTARALAHVGRLRNRIRNRHRSGLENRA